MCFRSKEEGGGAMGVRALLQAVRSQLFFSQLGAWLSSSGGKAPRHICYRLTVPGEAFASHFQRPPTEHSFPAVRVGRPNHRVTFQVSTLIMNVTLLLFVINQYNFN